MKILLAGPGTGKTTKIRSILGEKPSAQKVLILSFTNATVEDLKRELAPSGITSDNCMTLHKFAVKYNHDKYRHVLNRMEETKLRFMAEGVGVSFDQLCDFLACTTFDQMIERFVTYAEHNTEYIKEKINDFTTLIVDEYQDFNPHEQKLIDVLISHIEDVYILGDDDQCIYDFKDASTDKIIELHNTHPSLNHEHKCYRCPDKVVEHATHLIKKNTKRVEKKWEKTGKMGNVSYSQFKTQEDVAEYVLREIQKIVSTTPDEKILVLSPVEFAAKELAEKLDATGVDYMNYFIAPVSEELIVKSWLLRMLFGKYRYLNLVLLGYRRLSVRAKFYALLKKHIEEGQDFAELYALLKSKLPPEAVATYADINQALNSPTLSELSPLYAAAEGMDENEKLEAMFFLKEERPEKNIKLMTIHKSKGLGADHVFMIGLTEGIIPNRKKGTDSLESQRRLFYVGMTRTKKNLHLLSSLKIKGGNARTVNFADFRYDRFTQMYNGRASSFIEELGL